MVLKLLFHSVLGFCKIDLGTLKCIKNRGWAFPCCPHSNTSMHAIHKWWVFLFLFLLSILETGFVSPSESQKGTWYIADSDHPSPERWDHKHVPRCLASEVLGIEPGALWMVKNHCTNWTIYLQLLERDSLSYFNIHFPDLAGWM